MKTVVKIKENSWLARMASLKFKNRATAIVWGSTIHLHKASATHFLADTCWVKHELKHIEQYKQLGNFRFLFSYLWDSIKNGYYNNKFEKEARQAEEDPMPTHYEILIC